MTLNDDAIASEISAGRLVRNGDTSQIAGACYELRMGSVYYDLTESDKPIQLLGEDHVLVKPGHRVVLITHEEFLIPNDVLVRIVSKGSLFSIGLSPVATYADPGFIGNIGIVTHNISDKYIILPKLKPIAKADFTKLAGAASHPYHGQHGFSTQIWPIKHQLQKSHAEIVGDRRVGSEKEEAYRLLPHATREVLSGIEFRQSLTDFALVFAVLLNAASLFLVAGKFAEGFFGIVGNLVASAIVAVIVLYARLVNWRA